MLAEARGRILEQLVFVRGDAPAGRAPRGSRRPRRARWRRRCSACRPRTCRAGRCRCVLSKLTARIMSPPPCHGGIALEQRLAAVEHADAGRAAHLVAGERIEVAVERLHVDAPCAAPPARRRAAPARRALRALAIKLLAPAATVPSAFETCASATSRVRGRQQRLEGVEVDLAARVDRGDAQPRAGLLADHLPRHDVGVVLEVRDQDLVAGLQSAAARSSARPD